MIAGYAGAFSGAGGTPERFSSALTADPASQHGLSSADLTGRGYCRDMETPWPGPAGSNFL